MNSPYALHLNRRSDDRFARAREKKNWIEMFREQNVPHPMPTVERSFAKSAVLEMVRTGEGENNVHGESIA